MSGNESMTVRFGRILGLSTGGIATQLPGVRKWSLSKRAILAFLSFSFVFSYFRRLAQSRAERQLTPYFEKYQII